MNDPRTPEYRWRGLMSKSVQLEVFVRTEKTFPRFLGADLNISSKFLPTTSKKLVDFSKICSDWPHQALPPIFRGPTILYNYNPAVFFPPSWHIPNWTNRR